MKKLDTLPVFNLLHTYTLTEIFWENVGLTPNEGCERGMDQCKVNFAFDRMGLNWTIVEGTLKEYGLDTEWSATGDVKVKILSLRTICRQRFCVEETIGEKERGRERGRGRDKGKERESKSERKKRECNICCTIQLAIISMIIAVCCTHWYQECINKQ